MFTIKVNNRYTAEDFDDDLRAVMKRAGCQDEKICFIFDESNVLSSAFLERMNTLLAGGEVPGLFEGDEFTALMHACKDAANRAGKVIRFISLLWVLYLCLSVCFSLKHHVLFCSLAAPRHRR